MQYNTRKLTLFLIVFFFFSVQSEAKQITDQAQELYQKHQEYVFQIQVIDLATGKKNALGSGFQFTKEGHIATNFHVVSLAINHPGRYRVEYSKEEGTPQIANIVDVDVIHDLAILVGSSTKKEPLSLGHSELLKGTKIFSLGNPHDFGMTIIEGTYNGLMERSLYRKILFSGSLNSGMSGGPALNRDGEIIGVNVSTTGKNISFLVPVEFLKELYTSVKNNGGIPPKSWKKYIENQLNQNQDHYIDRLLESEWTDLSIGDIQVPGEILNVFKCWGESFDRKNSLFSQADIQCSSEDSIYLSSSFVTGKINYKYQWFKSKNLNTLRFYYLMQSFFGFRHFFYNANKNDATNFKCETDFVSINERDWKVAMCARNYKNYKSLYDVNVSMASVDEYDKGVIVELIALGIRKDRAIEFAKRFLKEIKWKE